MTFKLLYDLASGKVNLSGGSLHTEFMFFIVGIGLIFSYKINEIPKVLLLGVIFSIGSTAFIFTSLSRQHIDTQRAKQIIQNRSFFVVEGMPENYHPMPKEGHDTERFDINGVHFEYSDFILDAPGYNHVASLGGVIFPKNYYRLTYYIQREGLYKNKILRIEIRE